MTNKSQEYACFVDSPELIIKEVHRLIKTNPDSPEFYESLARSLGILNRFPASVRSYGLAQDIRGSKTMNVSSYLDLANSLAETGHQDKSLTYYQEVFKEQEVILFFSPDTGVTPHFAAQCVLAKILQDSGHFVVILPCGEIYHPFLLPKMEIYKEWFDNKTQNAYAQRYQKLARNFLEVYKLPFLNVKAFWNLPMSEELGRIMDELLMTGKSLKDFKYRNYSFGKLALFDLALTAKKFSFNDLDIKLRTIWIEFIKKNVMSYILLTKVYSTLNVKHTIHFNDYSPMLTNRLVAKQFGVSAFGLTQSSHRAVTRQHYVIVPQTFKETSLKQCEYWRKFRNLCLPSSSIKQVGDDVIFKFRGNGSHIYSPAKSVAQANLYDRLKLNAKRFILVAYTSSQDEVISINMGMEALGIELPRQEQPFPNQIAWLQALTDYVDNSANLQLVVRIHPRESRNKRDSQISEHLGLLIKHFSKPFKNCRIIWPEDTISSYDLAEVADIVLTSWSSMGLESARLGIPVLAATNGISSFPHDDFLEWGQTPQAYFHSLSKLVDRPASLETIAHAFRWYNLRYFGTSVDLSDIIPSPDFMGLPEFRKPREARTIEEVVIEGRDILDINYQRLEQNQIPNGDRIEKAAITQQLRRIIHFIFTGEDPTAEPTFYQVQGIETLEQLRKYQSECKSAAPETLIAAKDKEVFYSSSDGRFFSRYSPLVSRLIPLVSKIHQPGV